MFEKHGNKIIYPIYRPLCKHAGRIIKNQKNKSICKLEIKKNYLLFNEINRNLYIIVLKRTKRI